jgi:hypothetical protein
VTPETKVSWRERWSRKRRERRERSVERARIEAEARREYERSGKVGRHGVNEGYSSSSW